jgi:hypothetical protein
MSALSALADNFATSERPAGNLLDGPSVLAQALAAARFYAGYAEIRANAGVSPVPEITGDTEISHSEWALIRPLFLLYVERETALQLEASRGLGMDVFGRSSSEVASDIAQFEAELPHRAFCRPILTV